ncbi:MAG: gliding motility-associated C-terminal domain-containing protein [Bacteroidia bacterium]|nr:gliding motility-associated C-terminal domain-containing protein [Bacteroidia bacterium]
MKEEHNFNRRKYWFAQWFRNRLFLILLLAGGFWAPSGLFASHNMGANLTFECLSNCVIRVNLRAYRDCSGITSMAQGVTFTGQGVGCNQPVAVGNWSSWSIAEVTPICPSTSTKCTNNGAAINGVQEYYSWRDYNICGLNCTIYTMSWTDCCRNGAITSGATGGIYVNSTLNTSITPCNSSPQFTNPPIPYICAGQPFTFNQGAFDPDGDSLSYRFGPCNTGATTTVTYGAGYSYNQPLGASWNISINAYTGDITITPNPGNIVVGVFCVYVDEWRNGILINTIERDIQTTVINCGANTVPTVTGISGLSGGTAVGNVITTCLGSAISFNLNTADPNAGQTQTLSWNQNIAGAQFYRCGNPAIQNSITGALPCATFSWTPSAIGTYFFTVTVQDNACPIVGTNQYTYTINVGNMQVNVTDSVPGCTSADAFYCVTPTNGVPPYGFTWTGPGNLTSNPNATDSCLVHTYPGPGNYSYSVTVSDAFGCNVVTNGNVVIDFVLPSITGPADVCTSAPTATYSTPNVAGNSYAWYVSAGGTINSGQNTNSVNVTWSGAGTDTIRVTETNTILCDSTVELVVNVHANPVPVIAGPATACEFTPGHVYSVANSGNAFNWSITAGNGVITAGQGTNSATIKWLGNGAGTIQVTETDPFGCAGTATFNVTVNPKPYPVIAGPATACQLTGGNTYSVAAAAGNAFLWSISGGNGVITSGQSTNSINIKWTVPGNYTVNLTQSNGFSCDSTVSYAVTVNAKPTPVINGNLTPCAYTSGLVYSVNNNAGSTYNWSVGGSGNIVSGGNTNSVTVDWGAGGAGSLTVTETNASNCDSTVSVPVGVIPNPAPVISGPANACEFSSGHVYSVTNTFGSAYNWSIIAGNGVITAGQGSNSITIKWLANGAATVQVTETSLTTCDTTVTFNVQVDPKPYPVIAGPANACEFTSGHTYSVAAAAGNSYNWQITAGNGVITSGQGTNSIDIKWLANGPATVQVQQTNAAGCDSTVSFAVSVDPKPYPVIAGNNAPCAFTTGHGYSVTNTAGHTYVWTVTGSGTLVSGQNTNSITVDWGASGAGTVSVLEAVNGCDSSVTLNINVVGNPNPVIAGPATACEFTAGHVYSTASNAGSSYLWNIPSGGVITAGQNTNSITVKWLANGPYTVQVTETFASGCDTTVDFAVVVNAKPYPVIAGPVTACEYTDGHTYSVTAAAGNSYAWSVVAGSGVIYAGQGTNAVDVKWMANGAGTVQVTQTNTDGCDSTVTYGVTVQAKPYPVIAGNTQVCEYSTETYALPNTAGNSWSWTVTGNGNIVSGQNSNSISVKWDANGSGTVSVLETNAQGCDSAVTVNININAKPYPVITGPDSVCEYTAGHTYSTPNNAGNNYLWAISGAGVITSGQGSNSIGVKWMANGTYTVSVTETNPAGCDSTVSFTVVVTPKPYPVIAGPAVVCEFTDGHNYNITGAVGNSYLWTVTQGSGFIYAGQGTNAIEVKWMGNGPGTVQVQETNTFGCDSTVSFNVTVDPKPYPLISGPATLCEFTSGHTYAIASSAGSAYNWWISSGNGGGITSGQGSNSIQIQWLATGVDTVWVNHTNAQGCDSTVFFPVQIDPKPYPVISGPATVCEYTDGHNYSIPLNPGSSYAWSIVQGNGVIQSGQGTSSVLVKWLANSFGIVQVTETNSQGCDSTVTFNVTVNPKPYPTISGPLTACEHTSLHVYTAVNVPGMTYSWKTNGGNIQGLSTGFTVNVHWLGAGTGTLQLTATNPITGCDSTLSINVTIHPAPTPQVQGPSNLCAWSNSITYLTQQNGGSSYVWNINPGNFVSGQNSSSTVVNWTYGTGNGTIWVTETNGFGCTATDLLNVTLMPAPTPDIDGPIEVCQNVTHYYQTPAQVNNRYVWSIPANSGTIKNGQGTNQVGIYWTLPGVRTLTLYQQDTVTGCDTVVKIDVEIFPAIFADLEPDTIRGCDPLLVEFDGSQTPGAVAYKWFFGDGFVSLQPNIGHLYQGPGTYIPTLMVENSYGCKDTVDGFVEVLPSPVADFQVIFPQNKDFFYMTTDTFSAINLSQGAISQLWEFGDGSSDTSFVPWHVYASDGEMVIRLTVRAENGCTSYKEEVILVKIIDDIWIPTAFSPNGDGVNDEFRIVAHNLQKFYIAIYDRWGKMIFDSYDPNFSWNGFFRSEAVQEGVYTYICTGTKYRGETFKRGGTVTLIR